ncbi:sodium:proton antiporter, partial [bacterium]|nr:sodium:proton antiporter [bacterium]
MILDGIVIFCVLSGLFFFFGTSVGLLRFPGFYTRMHAAGKGDTLSSV